MQNIKTHMNYGNLSWKTILKESHKTLLKTHPRSPEKLIPPHQWIKDKMQMHLGNEYDYYAIGKDKNNIFNREFKVKGQFYDKMSDITVVKNNEAVGSISFKFVASNYSQNSNNYFENLLGECINIQSNNIPFCHVFVIRDEIPYYDNKKNIKKYEKFTEQHLKKYLIANHMDGDGTPSKISMSIIHITGDKHNQNIIHPTNFKKLNKQEQENMLNNIEVEILDYDKYYKKGISNQLKKMEINKTLKEFADIIRSK